ncbi:MAG: TIM barrel protein [Deinococcales bacterium]
MTNPATDRRYEDSRVGVQIYTLRHLLDGSLESYDKVLAEVARAGYDGIETIHLPFDPEALRDLYDKYELEVLSAHVSFDLLEHNLKQQLEICDIIENDYLILPYLTEAQRPREKGGWIELGKKIGRIGQACKQHGVRLLYHNHDFEMILFDGRTALEWLIEGAGVHHLGLELDLAWMVRGNRNPVTS